MERYGVIAIGYNRVKSMERLLNALKRADYKEKNVTLIISIDNSGVDDVIDTAQNFNWEYGEKVVKTYSERQGLRAHILKCGSYIDEYNLDAVAVFEDDVFPSPAFFNYMEQAVSYYKDDDNIAGISLYTHLWNVNASMPFQPSFNGFDNYFMCFAQSWGQVWMRKQWQQFMEWYDKHDGDLSECQGVPQYVKSWPKSSWLKYHIAYCIEKKKYFVYPYESLSTCFTEQGEHSLEHITLHQVPMVYNTNKKYNFVDLNNTTVRYDAYFERENLSKYLNINDEEICIDLYGKKKNYENKRYWLTTVNEKYKVLRAFALELRPHEENIVEDIQGLDIYLYDTSEVAKDSPINKYNILIYYFRLCRSGRWLIEYALKQKGDSIIKQLLSRK